MEVGPRIGRAGRRCPVIRVLNFAEDEAELEGDAEVEPGRALDRLRIAAQARGVGGG